MQAKQQCPPRKPLKKIIWSWLGSFLGIFLISFLNHSLSVNGVDTGFLIASFGASAVLVYGAPLAEFSQPRNLIGGHIVSALVGVSVFLVLGNNIFASAFAVSLAIAAMHFSRTLHPPGGATALIAVIGSDQVHSLGYWYVLTPILSGSILLLIVALFVNNMSSNPQRHYPSYWL